jgi:hypothetical protein
VRHGKIIRLITVFVLAHSALALAQFTAGQFDQLNTAIGQRVETAVVLGTANSISTGGYRWRLNDASGDITRGTWEFNLGDKHPIDDTGLSYRWNCDGGVGYANYTDLFLDGPLIGNQEKFQSYALGSNVGPRIFLTDDFSIMPEIGLVYGYTVNEFDDFTGIANPVLDSLVNWHVQTLSVTPSIQAQYARTLFGRLKLQARSNYAYYSTFPIERSTGALSFRSNSEVWQNSLDLDYNTGVRLLGCNLHLGGTFSRTDLFDGIEAAIDVDHYYNVASRLYLNTTGKLFVLSKLGVSGSYTWGHAFHGYAVGLVIDFSF